MAEGVHGGGAWWVACMARGMHCKGTSMAGGASMAGGHPWQSGYAWQGAFMPGGMHGGIYGRGLAWQEGLPAQHPCQILRNMVNERAVCITLECMLVESPGRAPGSPST